MPGLGAPPVYVHYPFDPLPYQHLSDALGFTFRPKHW